MIHHIQVAAFVFGCLAGLAGFVFLWATSFHRLLVVLRHHFLSTSLRFSGENFNINSLSKEFIEYLRAREQPVKQVRLRTFIAALENYAMNNDGTLEKEDYYMMLEKVMLDLCSRLGEENMAISARKLAQVVAIVEKDSPPVIT
jgi:hypothetical protein